MPQAHLPADDIGLPISRAQIEAQIDILIDLLNALDSDADIEPDLADAATDREGESDYEPSLGYSTGGYMPEWQRQEGRGFHMSADGGEDLEDEHDGCEPEDDSEPTLMLKTRSAGAVATSNLASGASSPTSNKASARCGNRVRLQGRAARCCADARR